MIEAVLVGFVFTAVLSPATLWAGARVLDFVEVRFPPLLLVGVIQAGASLGNDWLREMLAELPREWSLLVLVVPFLVSTAVGFATLVYLLHLKKRPAAKMAAVGGLLMMPISLAATPFVLKLVS